MKNDELMNRRRFFKKAAKGLLPMLGAFIAAPTIFTTLTSCGCNGCEAACSEDCDASCSGKCYGSCSGIKKHRFLLSLIICLIISFLTSPANAAYNIYVGDTYTCNLGYVSNFKECVWTSSDYTCLDFVGSVSRYSTEVTVKALAKPSYAVPVTIHCQYYYYDLDPVTGRYTYLRSDAKDFQFFIKESAVADPQSVSVYPSSLSLSVGEGQSLCASVYPSNANQSVSWSTSNYSVASVSSSGYVTARSAGEAYITATTTNGLTSSCCVSVQSSTPTPTPTSVTINATNFPDEGFRTYLLRQSWGEDGVITASEIQGITWMEIRSTCHNLQGIEFFTALEQLWVIGRGLSSIDISKNTALTELDCSLNNITTLDVSKNRALTKLDCGWNNITTLDVSKNISLTELDCSTNNITTLDVSKNISLTELDCSTNNITTLDVSKNTALTKLSCGRNNITTLDVSKNRALTKLSCGRNNITTLDVTKNESLTSLSCGDNVLTSLDVSKNTKLTYLDCSRNQIEGEAMSALISSLTINSTNSNDSFCVIDTVTEYTSFSPFVHTEGNVCTKSQVAAAKAKGWIPKCRTSFASWVEYEGSDDVQPQSITLPSTATVKVGQMVTLTATLTPDDAVTTLTWTSDDETIATVNNNGIVTGVKKGQTFINVETDNGKTAYCKLTVTAAEPTAISLPKNVTLMVGENITLTPTLTPEDAETVLTWRSDDETVVRVSADGMLTSVAEGLALVTVSTSNGLTSGACKVKVVANTNGINDLQTEAFSKTPVYTVSGQRLTAPRKGINIVGRRKVIIK